MSGIKYKINVLFLIDEIFNFFLDTKYKKTLNVSIIANLIDKYSVTDI